MLICFYYYVILFYYDCTFTSIYNIISLRGPVWAHKTCLTPPLYLPVTSPENERPYICVLGVSILPLSTICLKDFGSVLTVWYFCFCFLFLILFYVTFGDTMLFVFPNSNCIFKAALINF